MRRRRVHLKSRRAAAQLTNALAPSPARRRVRRNLRQPRRQCFLRRSRLPHFPPLRHQLVLRLKHQCAVLVFQPVDQRVMSWNAVLRAFILEGGTAWTEGGKEATARRDGGRAVELAEKGGGGVGNAGGGECEVASGSWGVRRSEAEEGELTRVQGCARKRAETALSNETAGQPDVTRHRASCPHSRNPSTRRGQCDATRHCSSRPRSCDASARERGKRPSRTDEHAAAAAVVPKVDPVVHIRVRA